MPPKPITRSSKLQLKVTEKIPSHFQPSHQSSTVTEESSDPFKRSARIERSPQLTGIFGYDPFSALDTDKLPEEITSASEQQNKEESQNEIPTEDNIYTTRSKKDLEDPETTIVQPKTTIVQPPPTISNSVVMANTTISDAFQATKTPSIPNFISPATFNPSRGNANTFITGYDRTAIANGWDEKLKICYFGSFLEGAANIWYKMYTNEAANINKTWQNISADFIKEFGDEDTEKNIEMQLLQRKQGENETVKAYFYDLKTLFYSYDPALDPEKFRKFFENGLRPNLYWAYRLIKEDNMTMEKFKNIVSRLDVLENAPGLPPPATGVPPPVTQPATKEGRCVIY